MANEKKGTHAVMKASLAKALIEAGIEHHDLGGLIGGAISGLAGGMTHQNQFHGELAPTTQSVYAPTIDQAQKNALAVNPQQQALAQTLLAQSQGVGPNPVQDQLNQNTGATVAAQGALAAGQRGASSNVGLMAKQIANQGAQIQQNAVGQAATLGAQQQLGAQQNLQNLYSQEQEGQNQLLATTTGAQNNQNANQVANYAQMQGINAGVAQNNATAVNTMAGGILNGLAGAGAAYLTPKKYEGGPIGDPQDLKNGGDVPGEAPHPGNDIRNDTELALLSKGEVVLPNSVTQSADPVKKAAEFMKHISGKSGDEGTGYDKVVQSKKTVKRRVEELEKLCMGGNV